MARASRQIKSHAIILQTVRFMEMHKNLTLFLPEMGIVKAIAHGALKPKSRYGGRCELFSLVLVDLYFSPVKNQYSVREIEVVEYFTGIREVSNRYLLAGCWADLMVQTEALNEPAKMFKLMLQALRFLNEVNVDGEIWLHLQFLLRSLAFGGLFPELEYCTLCEEEIGEEDRFFSLAGGEVFCRSCVKEKLFILTARESRYMIKTMKMNLYDSLSYNEVVGRPMELTVAIMDLIRHQLGIRLRSFDIILGAFK